MTTLLAIVPARAGSKGVPGKNRALIAGRPLIDFTIGALEKARSVTGISISTDDPEILSRYADRKNLFVIERPAELASDDATTGAVVAHALDSWESWGRGTPDALLLAQPTTPLRTAGDIDGAIALFERMDRQPVVSACKAEGIRHPEVMYRLNADGVRGELYAGELGDQARRQTRETVYQRNGAIYLVSTEFFRRTGRLRNANPLIYEMPWERSINIDVPDDLRIAKALIENDLLDRDRSQR
jgi:CMP-N,N'-diacetyllegionaminic acid synthase